MGVGAGFFYFVTDAFIGYIGVRHIVIQLLSRIVIDAEKINNISFYFIKISRPSEPAGLIGKQTAVNGGGCGYRRGRKCRGIYRFQMPAEKTVFRKMFL